MHERTNTQILPSSMLPDQDHDRILRVREEFLTEVFSRIVGEEIGWMDEADSARAVENVIYAYPLLKGLGHQESIAFRGLCTYLDGQSSAEIGRSSGRPCFSVDVERRQVIRNMIGAFKTLGGLSVQQLVEEPEHLSRRMEYITDSQRSLLELISPNADTRTFTMNQAARVVDKCIIIYQAAMEGVTSTDVETVTSRIRRLAADQSIREIAEQDGVGYAAVFAMRERFIKHLRQALTDTDILLILETRGEVPDDMITITSLKAIEKVKVEHDQKIKHAKLAKKPKSGRAKESSKQSINSIKRRDEMRVKGEFVPIDPQRFNLTEQQLQFMADHKNLISKTVFSMSVPEFLAEDARQEGFFGLLDAALKYDEAKETKFSNYASIRVRGSIADFLRRNMIVGRSDFTRGKLVEELTMHGRTDTQICMELDISQKQVDSARQARNTQILSSLDAISENSGSPWDEWLNIGETDPGYQAVEDQVYSDQAGSVSEQLATILDSYHISSRNKEIFRRHLSGENLKAIGESLGFTESRACQIYASITSKLREHFKTREDAADIISIWAA